MAVITVQADPIIIQGNDSVTSTDVIVGDRLMTAPPITVRDDNEIDNDPITVGTNWPYIFNIDLT